jgi:hypothetical protein
MFVNGNGNGNGSGNTGGEEGGGYSSQSMSVPVPFMHEELGLGEALKGLFSWIGVQPCGGCQKRAEALDGAVRFVPWGNE